ncbi:MAG: RidA family protein [Opitutus sp.]|nr:RidA family protein [Opitutus sp.]
MFFAFDSAAICGGMSALTPMKNVLSACAALSALTVMTAQTISPVPAAIQRIAKPDRKGTAWSVRAPDGPLLFTRQIQATDVSRDARGQAEQALDQVAAVVAAAGGDMKRILRLNAYVSDDAATAAVDAAIAARFADAPPAVTLAHTPLSVKGALVGFDVIAAVSSAPASVKIVAGESAVMPAGGKVFVSGQANPGPNLAASVATTMGKLHASLAHLGLGKADVVQVKAFITPFADQAAAVAAIQKSYEGGPVPPVVLIEWIATTPAEIELIAAAPTLTRKQEDAAAFLSLPGMPTSPYFCRIATVAAGSPLIFISGIDGGDSGSGRDQWKRAFDQLGNVLFEVDSSFRHLVKATYFLTDPAARTAMGEIRAVYYDPTRPASASALDVPSLGRGRSKVLLDMIAVPPK